MYSMNFVENMYTMASRCECGNIRANGSLSFSVFQESIFILAKQD